MNDLDKLAIRQAQTWYEVIRLKKDVNDGQLSPGNTRHTLERIMQLEEELHDQMNQVFKILETVSEKIESSKPNDNSLPEFKDPPPPPQRFA